MSKKRPKGSDVGYGHPPVHTRFKKGQSGNPGGRPPRPKVSELNVADALTEPIHVVRGGVRQPMPSFEAGLRRLVDMAVKERNPRAAMRFLAICEEYGLIKEAPPRETMPSVIVMPKDTDWQALNEHHWAQKHAEAAKAKVKTRNTK